MSTNTGTRRTIALDDDATKGLGKIKATQGVNTDNAAVNEAIKFRARLADKSLPEVLAAVSLWETVSNEIGSGQSVLFSDPKNPQNSQRFLLPSLK
jgi:hypothetical protein